ncbi:MAG: amidohydrolase family protein [Clostridiaceae bacterium]|nr:amidohydrolase family protein [Clostridiaceae bacterium]
MYDLIIKGATVITVDQQHRVFQPGYIAVKGDSIADIGPMEEFGDAEAERVIDASGLAVMPGLVDGHGHGGHCLIRTMGDHFENWDKMAEEIYFRYTDDFFWYAEGALAAAERLKFGITTAASMIASTPRPDRLEILEAHFEGALKTGIRELAGIGFCDGPWPKHPRVFEDGVFKEKTLTPEQVVENTERAVKELNGRHKRQKCIVAPGNITPWGDDSREFAAWKNREMARIAREYGVAFHTHARAGGIQFAYDTTPELFGPTTSLTHSTGLSQSEIDIVAKTGAVIFHGPTTRANISVRCPVYEILRAGGEVVIVTDGTAPDRSYDIWRDMKVFQVIHRINEHNSLLASPGRVLEMCTIRAARALGVGDITGSLEIGKRADIIIVNTKQPHLAPFNILPEARLVYHAQGQDVDTVIVDGQIMMEGRKLLCCDEKRILEDAEKAQNMLFERLGPDKMKQYTEYDGLYEIEARPTF